MALTDEQRKVVDLEDKISDLNDDLETEILKKQDLEDEISAKKSALNEAHDQIRDLNERLDELRQSFDEKVKSEAADVRKLEEEHEMSRQKNSELQEELCSVRSEVTRISEELSAALAAKEVIQRQLEQTVSGFEERLNLVEAQKATQVAEMESLCQDLRFQLSEAEKKVSKLETDGENMGNTKQLLITEKEAVKCQLESTVSMFEERLSLVKAGEATQVAELESLCQDLRSKLSEANTKISILEADVENLGNTKQLLIAEKEAVMSEKETVKCQLESTVSMYEERLSLVKAGEATQLAEVESLCQNLRFQLSEAEKKISKLEADVETLDDIKTSLVDEKDAALSAKETVQLQLESTISAHEERLRLDEAEKATKLAENESLCQDLRFKISEADKKISKLEADIETLNDVKQFLVDEKVIAETEVQRLSAASVEDKKEFER